MRFFSIIVGLGVLLAGCNMSGPGIARVGSLPAQGNTVETTYNSDWVNRGEPDPINSLDGKGSLSIDLTEREMGVRYLDEDTRIGEKYESMQEKRQRERMDARRNALRERMGLKTVVDEQKERDED